MLENFEGQTIRIRARFVKTQFGDYEFGAVELMILKDLVKADTGEWLDESRSIPYKKEAKAAVSPGDLIEFSAYIAPAKGGAGPSITKSSAFSQA
jgi:hypothetical protein